jgi:hypothetical protein
MEGNLSEIQPYYFLTSDPELYLEPTAVKSKIYDEINKIFEK